MAGGYPCQCCDESCSCDLCSDTSCDDYLGPGNGPVYWTVTLSGAADAIACDGPCEDINAAYSTEGNGSGTFSSAYAIQSDLSDYDSGKSICNLTPITFNYVNPNAAVEADCTPCLFDGEDTEIAGQIHTSFYRTLDGKTKAFVQITIEGGLTDMGGGVCSGLVVAEGVAVINAGGDQITCEGFSVSVPLTQYVTTGTVFCDAPTACLLEASFTP